MTSDAPLPPDRMLCFALYSATHAMQAVYAPLLEPLGLTYPQYLVLSVLWQKDGQGVGEIGRALGLESNTLTPILKRMAAAGLILRERDGGDERRVTVRLTAAGLALRAHAGPIAACIGDRTGLPAAEIATLQAQVTRLAANLRRPPGG